MTETENTISTGKDRNSADHCRISNSISVNNPAEAGGEGKKESSSSSSSLKKQGKSCKGCLYYSSTYKSNSRNPLCLGLSRSLPQVPQYIVGKSEMQASKEGGNLTDFRYACIGYSVYLDQKARSADGQGVQTELPVCAGLEVLVDRKVSSAEAAPGHARKREDGHGVSQPGSHKPTHSTGNEFLTRFTRNANLVALGVAKNLQKVGNRIKEGVDDIFYRRPK
ncbi:uncharacterized protein LOC125860707 isoform X1 [Solanum stenotomum]|uniref:uncharacterized protein LOC125860707 isoform X1 n=1 Tax=Solanum stenotomum TaxID=172797 RepID=UPI0020D1E18B|nr:uncharacterized protein LOC125860707 isoform X1 [Solanum stenotomum]XP_049396672.1 uncharacterized protein LOC125860707 isoform X1 [Solanum stenotomum]